MLEKKQKKTMIHFLAIIALLAISSFGTSYASGLVVKTYTLQLVDGVGGTWDTSGSYVGAGSHSVPVGTRVRIHAVAGSGYQWSGWRYWVNGVARTLSTPNPTVFLSNTPNYTFKIQPIFTPTAASYTLTIKTPIGSGSVTPVAGTYRYTSGTKVTLTANPSSGYSFAGWSGSASGTSNPISITINSNKAVTATFAAKSQTTYTLTTGVSPSSGGTITRNNNGPYHLNDIVTLTETPNTGFSFSSWSGAGTGTSATRTVTITGNMAVTATFTQASAATYTIKLEGSVAVARDPSGNVKASNTDFGALLNSLNSKLVSGNSVLIKSGVYTLATSCTITTNHVTVVGEAGAKLIHRSGLKGVMITMQGSYNTVSGITFDDGLVGGSAAAVVVRGSYNTLKGCTLTNCDRYGFSTWGADHFNILDNTVLKAQYGIAGLDNEANSIWSSNGLVQGNKVYDCRDACIKMKMWKNVLVTKNTVDVGYKTWGKAVSNGQFGTTVPSDGCVGIWYYHLDTPTQTVTVSSNIVTDSTKAANKGIGILVDPDRHLDWPSCPYSASGMKILNNVMTVPFFGMIIQGNGVEAKYNDCSIGGIRVDGNNNILTGNIGSIRNNGSGNIIN